jgi:hypothetical protein
MGASVFNWTDEIVETCKSLRLNSNLSAQAIAEHIGNGMTRNMVIGKLSRLGIMRKPEPQTGAKTERSKPRTPNKTVTIRPRAGIAPPMPIPEVPVIAGKPVHILDVQRHHCRCVLDERGADGLALYCGAPKVVGSSYCEDHTALFLAPIKDSGQTSNGK